MKIRLTLMILLPVFLMAVLMTGQPQTVYGHAGTGSHQHPHDEEEQDDTQKKRRPEKEEKAAEKEKRREEKRKRSAEKKKRNEEQKNKDAEQDQKIKQLEAESKTSKAVENVKDAVGLIPVVGSELEKVVHYGSKLLPTHVCEKCGEIYHFSHECWKCDVCGEWYTDRWQGGHASCSYKCVDCGAVGSHKCYY